MDTKTFDFLNESTYRELLKLTKAKYTIKGFEVLDCNVIPTSFAIIRHDVDMSPERALALAKIEAEEGIRATYTILLTGEFYSPFEKQVRNQISQIAELGHDIGLHFDAAWHGIETEIQLEDKIQWETEILTKLLSSDQNHLVRMFSFHNTTPFTMGCRERSYGGLRNAYAGVLQDQVQYTSDSNGYWIHRSWKTLLDENHERIQVLTHPEWWSTYDAYPGEKVTRTLMQRHLVTWANYCDLLQIGNRNNKLGLRNGQDVLRSLWGEKGENILLLWLNGNRNLAALQVWLLLAEKNQEIVLEISDWQNLFEEMIFGKRQFCFTNQSFEALLSFAEKFMNE